MSHPNPSHDKDNEYPEDGVTHYPKKHHGHNKRGKLGAMEGLMNTKYFGAKRRARHNNAKSRALKGRVF